jgi:hypothetical protein
MRKRIAILLVWIALAGFAGCGAVPQHEASEEAEMTAGSELPSAAETTASPEATEDTAAGNDAPAEPTPEPTPEPVSYAWDGIELVLNGITDDFEADPGMSAPSGKYVLVTLSVRGGELIVDDFVGVYKSLFTLTCEESTYPPVSFVAQSASIDLEQSLMLSSGPLLLYFDLPADADISGAVFAVAEPS